jgi:hypothetical protein
MCPMARLMPLLHRSRLRKRGVDALPEAQEGAANESRVVATGNVWAGSGRDGSVLRISKWVREDLKI